MFEHRRQPLPRRSAFGRVVAWMRGGLDDLSHHLRSASRIETTCMSFGLGGMALAIGVTVAQGALSPVIATEEALRRAVISADFDDALCPNGWAQDHAAFVGMTEAEVMAWYLRTSLEMSDADVIRDVGFYLANAQDFRMIEGLALTRNQILLCVAESRRLTQPIEDLLPPHLRGDLPGDT